MMSFDVWARGLYGQEGRHEPNTLEPTEDHPVVTAHHLA